GEAGGEGVEAAVRRGLADPLPPALRERGGLIGGLLRFDRRRRLRRRRGLLRRRRQRGALGPLVRVPRRGERPGGGLPLGGRAVVARAVAARAVGGGEGAGLGHGRREVDVEAEDALAEDVGALVEVVQRVLD